MKAEIREFRAEDAPLCVKLAESAFQRIRADAQPTQDAAFVARILGAENPAGPSLLTVVRDDRGVLGCAAAVPGHYRSRAGAGLVGYQIGYFFVEQRVQRSGLGNLLIESILDALREDPTRFVYAMPNPRSMGHARRYGFDRAAHVPARIHPGSWRTRPVLRSGGRRFDLESLDAAAAARAADTITPEPAPGFVRDAARFRWRFCGAEARGRYRFVRGRPRDGGAGFLAVATRHAFAGVAFSVLVDLVARNPVRDHPRALAALRRLCRREGTPCVYETTNREAIAPAYGARRAPHLALRVPLRLDPRPVELMLYPEGCAVPAAEFGEALIVTGDWLAF